MKKFNSYLLLMLLAVASISAVASDSFREHRYDMFHALPVRSTDIVMMGNSITDMPNWPEFFTGTSGRVINRGNSGGYSYEMRDNIECVLAGKPAKIFMKIGTNDLGGSKGYGEFIAKNVRECVERCKKESPNTEFYIESILPAKDQGYKTTTTIAEANRLLKEIADEDPNDKVYWVELNSLFGGAVTSLPSNCTLDDLHLSAGGYKIWCDAIVKYMGPNAKVVLPDNIASTQNKCGLGHPNGTRNTYFSGVPVTGNDILFIGDEMIKCGEWQELLGNDNVKNRGYGWGYGGSISVINTSLSAIFNGGQPKAIYLYTGTADLNNGASALATNKTAYQNLVKAIRAKAPNAPIVLMGNLPVSNTTTNTNSIKPFNQWLAQLAASMDNVEYVDLYTPFCTNNVMNETYVRQGTMAAEVGYLYGLGYAKVAELLKPSLDKITGLDNDVVTEKEAKANIKYFSQHQAEAPAGAIMTVEDKEVTTAPFVLPAELAEPVLKCEQGTLVVDYTLPALPSTQGFLIAASNPTTDKFFGVVARGGNSAGVGVRYSGLTNNLDGWFTRNTNLTGTHKLVVVMAPETGYSYYLDGTLVGEVTAANLAQTPEYGFANFSNVGATQITLGGVESSRQFTNLVNPLSCTFHKVRYYTEAMTAAQVAMLDQEPATESTITYVIDKENGDLYNSNGSANQNWNATWKSKKTPQLELTAGVNNMAWKNNTNVIVEPGSSGSSTYTIKAPVGYLVKDVKMTVNRGTKDVNFNVGGEIFTTSTTPKTITVTDHNRGTFQFYVSNNNGAGTYLTDFEVTVINEDEVEPGEEPVEPELFTVLDNSGSVPYRIPAIATAQNGNLIVVADYRTSKQDIGSGEIDLHLRLSSDNGATWGNVLKPKVMDGDGKLTAGYQLGAFGDPCIVADRTSSKVMIMSCSGHPGYFNGTRTQHQGLARWYSYDNGETWDEAPSFIDEEFIYSKLDKSSYGPITGMFVGSGKIHQSRYVKVNDYYRLYCSFSCHKAGSASSTNFVIYSDDFGQTWDFLGGVEGPSVPTGGDEPKVDELPNGNVVFSGRRYNAGGRNINIFQFSDITKAEGKWMGVKVSDGSVSGITNNNACNGEILIVPAIRKSDNTKGWLALQSVPLVNRTNVGLFWKFLDEEDTYDTPEHFAMRWEGPHQSSWTTSCYSTMSVQANKHIAFVYEENSRNQGYDIQYKDYTLETITDGKYSYDTEADPEITVMPLSAMDVTPENGTVEKIEKIEVAFTKELIVKTPNVTLAEGITATATAEGKKLTLTLTNPITEKGTYKLTIPAGVVGDQDEQLNKAIEVTYRILGVALPLGDVVTSIEDVDAHKTYALYNPASKGYAVYAPNYHSSAVWAAGMQDIDASHKVSNPTYSEAPNFADPCAAWALVNYNNEYYMYNVGAEKFLKVARPTVLVDEASAVTFASLSNGFAITTTGGTLEYMCASPQLSEPIAIWNTSDSGSCWQFHENPNVEDAYAAVMAKLAPVAISVVNRPNGNSQSFDLQGRRVDAINRSGLYIINGRKEVR